MNCSVFNALCQHCIVLKWYKSENEHFDDIQHLVVYLSLISEGKGLCQITTDQDISVY